MIELLCNHLLGQSEVYADYVGTLRNSRVVETSKADSDLFYYLFQSSTGFRTMSCVKIGVCMFVLYTGRIKRRGK